MNQAECRAAIIERLKNVRRRDLRLPGCESDDTSIFNMARVTLSCGAPSCLAGHVLQIAGIPVPADHRQVTKHMAQALGIGHFQSERLFLGRFARYKRTYMITPAETLAELLKVFKQNPLPEDCPETAMSNAIIDALIREKIT